MRLVRARLVWNGRALATPYWDAQPGYRDIHILPEPSHPFGRKGLALATAWQALGQGRARGMIVLDGDVAIDPLDEIAMTAAVESAPDAVHIAPARLFPRSSGRAGWIWAHWGETGEHSDFDPFIRHRAEPITRFSFSYTYLPEFLLRRTDLARWAFPVVDQLMSKAAVGHDIPRLPVPECHPKHLHY